MSFLDTCLSLDFKSLEKFKDIFTTQTPNHFFTDNFFNSYDAKTILNKWPSSMSPYWKVPPRMIENNVGNKREISSFEHMDIQIQEILKKLHDKDFIKSLEYITGIPNLYPDEHMYGCGLIETPRNGFLKIHADFNYLEKIKKYRRINIVIYMNEDWKNEWNGHIKFYSEDTQTCIKSYCPLFNYFILFKVSDKVYHGYPELVDCPTNMSRKSINFFYYTDEPDKDQSVEPHKTLWKTNLGEDIPY